MAKKIDHNSLVNQDIKRQFVGIHVHQGMTYLIEDCFKKGVMNYEDIENLYTTNDEGDAEERLQDILEWWLIDEFLYEQLKKHGEPVLSYDDYNYFWGRTTSGQAILLDGVISDICAELEILDGQKNSWK